MSSQKVCRWGILGAADIARKNWQSIWHADHCHLVAVASRDGVRAAKFIEECQSSTPFDPAPDSVEGYDALLSRDDVDAVYIPLPTGVRGEWALRAAEAGKHVLLEKPCGTDLAELQSIVDKCQANNLQLMDGVMQMHTDRMQKIREVLDDGTSIGKIRRIATHFCFNGGGDFHQENIRVNEKLEPLGCLGDVGWYCIRFILWAMKWELPTDITARTLTGTNPSDAAGSVPLEFEANLRFASGTSANFYSSFITEMQQWVSIGGTDGFLTINDFTLPYHGSELEFTVDQPGFSKLGCDFVVEPHQTRYATREYSHGHPTAQESKMFSHFSKLVATNQREECWAEYTLATQRVMDACIQSAREDGKRVAL